MSQTAVIGRAAESFVIEGGRPLQGRIRASGNKNGALPILAACLLTAEPVLLHNVPRIVDVETMIELLNDIGVEAEWVGPNDVQVHAAAVLKHELDQELCSRMRASFLLAGPLLARVGRVSAPPPGRRRDRPTPARSAYPRFRQSSAPRSRSAPATRCAAARYEAATSSSTRRA